MPRFKPQPVCLLRGAETGDYLPCGSFKQPIYACQAEENARGQCVSVHPRDLCAAAKDTELPICDRCDWKQLPAQITPAASIPPPVPAPVPAPAAPPRTAERTPEQINLEMKERRARERSERLGQHPPGLAAAIVEEPWVAPAKLVDWFDDVVLINLDRRPDRLEAALFALRDAKWPFLWPRVFHAIDGAKLPTPIGWPQSAGAWGCMQSHRQVLEQAILRDTRSLLVLEDDLLFQHRFAERVEEFLAAVPSDWSQLMLGGKHVREPSNVGELPVLRCQSTQCTHAYAVRGQYLHLLYRHWHSSQGHCDHRMAELHAGAQVYAPLAPLLGQAGGKSDISGRENVANWV